MTHRWANAEQSAVIRESDGASIPAELANTDYALLVADGVQIAPFQRFASLSAARGGRVGEVEAKARAMRIAVAGTDDATKLAVYREKYATAVSALAGDQVALAALTPEATARGATAAQLAALVKSLGDAWTAAGLQIDAAYQTHKAAILAAETIEAVEAIDIDTGWPGQ